MEQYANIRVKIIADSISNGIRLTTYELSYPRFIHQELMTHRVFSRNASSSRAIPVAKLVQMALENMVFPLRWGTNKAGMQADATNLSENDERAAKGIWKAMAASCANGVTELAKLGLHKQWANRALEWFSNISVVVTSTEWDNFFELRDHSDAQPEIEYLAKAMKAAKEASTPRVLRQGEWHLPYITEEELGGYNITNLRKMSAARCARVSYLLHDGAAANYQKDIELFAKLILSKPAHASPVEHQATPMQKIYADELQFDPGVTHIDYEQRYWSGNFRGWVQFRQLLGV